MEKQPGAQMFVGNVPIRVYTNDAEQLQCQISLDGAVSRTTFVSISLFGYEVERTRSSLAP